VTGHVSPIAHDYGVVEWRSLEQTVDQRFVAGPGHQAAIANDGKTTPEQFHERLAALPEDARTGTLLEIAVGLRLEGENGLEPSGVWNTGARLQLFRADAAPLLDLSMDDLPRDGDWLRIEDPPSITSGEVVNLRIVPGAGPDADRLRYGVIPDRAPYGGWLATNAAGESAGGALLLRTSYERNVALNSIVTDGLANLRDAAGADLLFGAAWALALAGMLTGAGWLCRLPPARDA
jgi:hypothetical protein